MIVALRTGIAHEEWLADTRALFTAVEVIEEIDRAQRRR